ncbi:MAG TPA: hypothetical protein VGD67_18500 [Pseudonocardiaceae bacterium]
MARPAVDHAVYCGCTTFSSLCGGYRISLACNNRAVAGAGTVLNDVANNAYFASW